MDDHSSSLSLWQTSNQSWLQRVAKVIDERQLWSSILSSAEHEVFHKALKSSDSEWTAFLEPQSIETSWPATNHANGIVSNGVEASDAVNDDVDQVTVAFRTRFLLYDQAVSDLFPMDQDPSSVNVSDLVHQPVENGLLPEAPSRVDQHENYDEDYDEDADIEVNGDDTAAKPEEGPMTEILEDVEPLLNKMFYSLEYDRAAWTEQRQLDESDRQINAESEGTGLNQFANFGAAQLSLQHLLNAIDRKRDQLSMTEPELRHLLSEVRKNRSKWASEDKVGQEELYEACERVVTDLRGYTEHSTAFLNRVKKHEAPDYLNIIKHPMDLGTVMKKLKAFQYKSKNEFVDDLMLIWDNCLLYNANPQHFLRKHALAMRKKTLSLVNLIPDITIRERADMEAEDESHVKEEDHESEEDVPLKSSRKAQGLSTKSVQSSKRPAIVDLGDSIETKAEMTREHSQAPTESGYSGEVARSISNLGIRASPAVESVSQAGEQGDIDRQSDVDDENEADVLLTAWKSKTKKARARYLSDRHRQLRGNRLFEEHSAIVRSKELMMKFAETEKYHDISSYAAERDKANDVDPSAEEIPFLFPYEVASGIPDQVLEKTINPADQISTLYAIRNK